MTVRYVLSLPEAYERRKKLKKQFDSLGLDFEILEAKKFSKEEVQRLISEKGEDFFKIGVGSVGCYLSHIEAWGKISRGACRGGFVFEDDVVFSKSAYEFCVNDDWIPEGVDVCQLSYWPSAKHPRGKMFRVKKKLSISNPGYELINIYSPCPWGMQGYWISRNGAKKALSMFDFRFRDPVDFFVFSKDSIFWKQSAVYSLTPAVVTELPGGVSQRMAIDSEMHSASEGNFEDGEGHGDCGRKLKKFLDRIVKLLCEKRYHGFEE